MRVIMLAARLDRQQPIEATISHAALGKFESVGRILRDLHADGAIVSGEHRTHPGPAELAGIDAAMIHTGLVKGCGVVASPAFRQTARLAFDQTGRRLKCAGAAFQDIEITLFRFGVGFKAQSQCKAFHSRHALGLVNPGRCR